EQFCCIVWSGTRFRVPLKTEGGLIFSVNTLKRIIKKRTMRCFQTIRQTVFVCGKTVVLTGNHYMTILKVLHWMVTAVMTKFHFYSLCTAGKRQQLMPQANTKNGNIGFQKLFNRGDRVVTWFRVARAIGKKNTIRFHRQHIVCRCLCRYNGKLTSAINQHA